jgi:hypothetical protein
MLVVIAKWFNHQFWYINSSFIHQCWRLLSRHPSPHHIYLRAETITMKSLNFVLHIAVMAWLYKSVYLSPFLWIVAQLMLSNFYNIKSLFTLLYMLFIFSSSFQAAIVGRTLRILLSILQHLLNYGTKSSERYTHQWNTFLVAIITAFHSWFQLGYFTLTLSCKVICSASNDICWSATIFLCRSVNHTSHSGSVFLFFRGWNGMWFLNVMNWAFFLYSKCCYLRVACIIVLYILLFTIVGSHAYEL